MSQQAIDKLREMWSDLVFARVARTRADETRHVLQVWYQTGPFTTDEGCVMYQRSEHVPVQGSLAETLARYGETARAAWTWYEGWTDSELYFCRGGFSNLRILLDVVPSEVEQRSEFDKPEAGDLILGIRKHTEHGWRLSDWCYCPEPVRYLVAAVRAGGTALAENEIVEHLLCDGYPDSLWAIARLVFYDNVQAFVDTHYGKGVDHPWYGKRYGSFYGPAQMQVKHNGMYLSSGADSLVHELSYVLVEPAWWAEFQRLAAEQGHFNHNSTYCSACRWEHEAERDEWAPSLRGSY